MGEITKNRLVAYYIVSVIVLFIGLISLNSSNWNAGYFSGFAVGFGPLMLMYTLVYHWMYFRKFKRFL